MLVIKKDLEDEQAREISIYFGDEFFVNRKIFSELWWTIPISINSTGLEGNQMFLGCTYNSE